MAGHGRGVIKMTQAELDALIITRVVETLAASQAGNYIHDLVSLFLNSRHLISYLTRTLCLLFVLKPTCSLDTPACTFKTFMDCKPHTFGGHEGAVGLLRWFERTESIFLPSATVHLVTR